MTRADAEALWGVEAVGAALAAHPDPMTSQLVDAVRVRAADLTDAEFSSWALALPWPRFAAVVRLVAGVTRAELLTMGAVHE
jgi:hypothetical protein